MEAPLIEIAVAVDHALDGVPLDDRDQGAAQLAREYAAAIQRGGDIGRLGPALLATLDALLLTPRARAAVSKVVTDSDQPERRSPLDELRARRAARGTGTD